LYSIVALHLPQFLLVTYQMIVAFVLPERIVPLKNPVCFVSRESLERIQPSLCVHLRSDQHVHVVRHHHESMDLISLKPMLAVVQSSYYDLGDFRLAKE
jgi:hypothetical protein